ncbi:hypothetical protein [Enterococcus sp.]|uniref:hypothetical protein n=1 Tax=Enterococcus sp. TaxID=35783 RepID=UPI003C77D66F
MNKEELIQKVKDLIGEGNIEAAQKFVEEHKDDLGEYADKAKNMITNFNPDEFADKAKDVFDDAKAAASEPDGIVDKIKDLFNK